jgi:hypothetical protein
MNGVEIIETHTVMNLAGLRQVLERLSNGALHQIDNHCVSINDSPAQVVLERQTLTDGSEVYNISIEKVGK